MTIESALLILPDRRPAGPTRSSTASRAAGIILLPRYPVLSAGLIGRLAVDRRYRGERLGGTLIVDAIARAVRAEPAIFALVVDAKDDPAFRFYRHHGFHPFASRPLTLYLPAKAARHLATER